jgi:hypothetical protein
MNPSELWNMIFSHLHYKALSSVSKMVTRLPEIQEKPDNVCKGCAQRNNMNQSFPSSDNIAKGVLDIVHSYVCVPMSTNSLREYVYYVFFIDDLLTYNLDLFVKGKE